MRTGKLVAAVVGLTAGVLTACASVAGPAAGPATHPAKPSRPAPTISTPESSSASSAPSVPTAADIAAPKRPPNRCAHNTAAQLVLVKLDVQHLWLCAKDRTVHDYPITSGMAGPYTHTPTGHFHIQGRNRNSVLTLNTGASYDVKYWIPFDAPLFGFHDASWQHFPYGSAKYRTAGSHGCIHLPLKAIAFLYRWVDIGTPVDIRG